MGQAGGFYRFGVTPSPELVVDVSPHDQWDVDELVIDVSAVAESASLHEVLAMIGGQRGDRRSPQRQVSNRSEEAADGLIGKCYLLVVNRGDCVQRERIGNGVVCQGFRGSSELTRTEAIGCALGGAMHEAKLRMTDIG